uniref:Uncharacterized protein n=1 Tax=Salix viminalis TaxID=40686 RepID=A0A6N2KWJ3_SALVM
MVELCVAAGGTNKEVNLKCLPLLFPLVPTMPPIETCIFFFFLVAVVGVSSPLDDHYWRGEEKESLDVLGYCGWCRFSSTIDDGDGQ